MLGDLVTLSSEERASWIDHLDSFALKEDGLFYDPVVDNPSYRRSDWWGARHIALHVVACYAALEARPPYPLRFLDDYKTTEAIDCWLVAHDWNGTFDHTNAIDNQIINIGCLL